MTRLALAVAAAIVTAPGVAVAHTLTAEQTAAIESGVRDGLKDPDSAKFRGFRASAKQPKDPKAAVSTYNVCGYVNAKNSYGGYTGAMPFSGLLFAPSGKQTSWFFVPILVASTRHDIAVARDLCRKDGLAD